MNILIIHAHTANRGDESALKAMCDELISYDQNISITIALNGLTRYPNMPKQVKMIDGFFKSRDKKAQIGFFLATMTNGKIAYTDSIKTFIEASKNADLVIHAPGGPSIGDIYSKKEFIYLRTFTFMRSIHKPYMFYALSMGPFNIESKNNKRRQVLNNAEYVILRDPISFKYVDDFAPECHPVLALDSALQHDFEVEDNRKKFENYNSLANYISSHDKIIGLTITDLKWHQKYKECDFQDGLKEIFNDFIEKRLSEGYGIVFIPQLYGTGNDEILMSKYMVDGKTFMVSSKHNAYDSYFQQYLISRLYAVVGMRYHSNIFSAKAGTPFISISYEQKMQGFMEAIECSQYCINLENLSGDLLENKFREMIACYQHYKDYLNEKHEWMKSISHISTDKVIEIIEKINQKDY